MVGYPVWLGVLAWSVQLAGDIVRKYELQREKKRDELFIKVQAVALPQACAVLVHICAVSMCLLGYLPWVVGGVPRCACG